ncbi:hypothetical protein AC578_5813 [Pseudocercospora eumusae]|uniref:Uncharacterized protein n=1 Tax=Pseudocercospora eumusae TaxID=321146 RepID=A0A139HCC0_9PEZI|nr:hypothetical protein AC578_5813 [Pseudocercospora eumusae]
MGPLQTTSGFKSFTYPYSKSSQGLKTDHMPQNSANILQQLYVHKVATSSYLNTPLGPGRDPDKASPHSESSWSANPDDEWPPGNIEAKTENEVNAKSDETARQRALDIAGEVVLLG